MSIEIRLEYQANCSQDDNGKKQWTQNFVLRDTDGDEIEPTTAYAEAYAYIQNHRYCDGLKAKSLELDAEGDGARRVWHFAVTYAKDGELGNDDGESTTVVGTLRFSTKGGSTHINKSLQTRTKQPNPNLGQAAPDFKGLINVQDNTPAGVDIQVPCLHVDVTAKVPTRMITSAWLQIYYNLTGKVNNTGLWNFPAHTLIFRGVDGSTDGSGACNLTFSFDFSPNVSVSYDPFSQITKNGWEYVWVHNTLTTDSNSNTTVATPDGLYVEQVYEEASFQPFQFIVVN